jgi:hypothetical protein
MSHGLKARAEDHAMNVRRRYAHAAALLLVLCALGVGSLQGHAEGNGLTLGNVAAAAKGKVIVPLLLELDSEEVRVGHIAASIGYNADVVTFQQAEKGFLLDAVGGKFTVTQKLDGATSAVEVDIITEGEPRKPLRKGLVLSLVFKVNENAVADTKMPLTFSTVKLLTPDAEPKPIEPVTQTAGEIAVLAPENVPFVSCFFFTH